jgi:hypothetical protein
VEAANNQETIKANGFSLKGNEINVQKPRQREGEAEGAAAAVQIRAQALEPLEGAVVEAVAVEATWKDKYI